jgi:hypothetical protein
MGTIDIIIQYAVQVLSSSAWAGIGVTISAILTIIALHKSNESQTPSFPKLALKKFLENSNS